MIDQIKRYESTALSRINDLINYINNKYSRQLEFIGYKGGKWLGRELTTLLIKCNKHNTINEVLYLNFLKSSRKDECYEFSFCSECKKEAISLRSCKFKTREEAETEINRVINEINSEGFNVSFLGFVDDKFYTNLNDTKVIIRCNIHNKISYQRLGSFLSNKRFCEKCKKRRQMLITNQQIYEELVAKDRFGYDFSKILGEPELGKFNTRPITAICPVHGEFTLTLDSFLRETSRPHCYLCWKEKIEKDLINSTSEKEQIVRNSIDMKREKYGIDLEFLGFVGGVYKGNTTKLILKCNTCGRVWDTTLYSHFVTTDTYCGCPVCSKRINAGEKECLNILKNVAKVSNLIQQYRFDYVDSATGKNRKMFWDFYLPDQNIVIEFNGEQHYRYTEFFWSDYGYYEKQKERDQYLVKYCSENNIKLLVIPYLDKRKKRLEEVILKFLNTGEDISTPLIPK